MNDLINMFFFIIIIIIIYLFFCDITKDKLIYEIQKDKLK